MGTQRIHSSNFDEATKKAALKQLLHKETKLLQTVDRLKIQAHAVNRDAKTQQMLEAMAKPKVWAQTDGEATTVHTPFTTRAKELMDLYKGLRLPLLSIDERLDVLLHVKWTVKEFDCNLTREIVDLVDREADMLNRGRPEKSFKGCRQRLANFFCSSSRRRSSTRRRCASRRFRGSCTSSPPCSRSRPCPLRVLLHERRLSLGQFRKFSPPASRVSRTGSRACAHSPGESRM